MLIQFDSVKAAGIAADLKFVELYDSKVNLEQMFEAPPVEVPTCKIKATQLPNIFEEVGRHYLLVCTLDLVFKTINFYLI